ncbi:MAG TPA: SDR family NAD(P)-dependent oxidoreductase [Phycisphaerae bacterium]|jgi:NAD(P)-dependent dehydrogenase (short-subunit alcohol dehydrogenase family)|nr:SDR family NAD(P)-dependent oxidoreductase [Phycisphaerae bacterium]
MRFEGRTVVVTGGTGALGAAIVALIAGEGGRCVVPSHRPAEAPKVAGPGSVEIVAGIDLADEASVEKFYAGLPACWASIHAAGGFTMGPIARTGKADFQKMMETNALTAFLCCREAAKRMRAAGVGGRIVNVAAKPALHAVGGMVAYSMSKAAVVSLTQSLAEEVAGDGIWVNAVVPSVMDTAANRASFPAGTDFSKWPKVEEVAETVAFLASPENKVSRGGLMPVYGRA